MVKKLNNALDFFKKQSQWHGVVIALLCLNISLKAQTFGGASDFNLFSRNGVQLNNSDVEGRVAAGGNSLIKDNYRIGYALAPLTTRNDLIVDGTLTTGWWMTMSKGSAVHSGAWSNNGTNGMFFGNAGSTRTQVVSPINFTTIQTELTTRSTNWSNLIANGTVSSAAGVVTLTGTNTALNVFNFPSGFNYGAISTLQINIPTGSTILINYGGTTPEFSNISGIKFTTSYWNGSAYVQIPTSYLGSRDARAYSRNIMWNFYQATSLTVQNIGFKGSIIAPNADLYSGGTGSHIDGQVMVKSVSQDGTNPSNMQFNWFPFNGKIPCPSYPNVTATSNSPVTVGATINLTGGSSTTALTNSIEMLNNGDFAYGWNEYLTDYPSTNYSVVSNTSGLFGTGPNCNGRAGVGNLLGVNGNSATNWSFVKVSLPVVSGRTYTLSFWSFDFAGGTNAARPQWFVNNVLVGSYSNLSGTTNCGAWVQNTTTWTATSTGNIVFGIVDTKGIATKFAVDDISIRYTDTNLSSWSWTGPSSFTSAVQSPTRASATAVMAGPYTLTRFINGCTNTATANVTVGTCSALTSAGAVGANQTACGASINPVAFTETTVVSGGSGTLEYQWQSSLNNSTWFDISGATSATYDAPTITQTTYYRRGAKRAGCPTYLYTSAITVTVKNIYANAGADQTQCYNNGFIILANARADASQWGAWSVVSGSTTFMDTDMSQNKNTVMILPGATVTLRWTMTDGTCTATDDVVLSNTTSCSTTCPVTALNLNGDLESEGTATNFNLTIASTPALVITTTISPTYWEERYGSNITNTATYQGAYYIKKTGATGNPHSGTHYVYLKGSGFCLSAFGSPTNVSCGKTYKVSAWIAAYSYTGSQLPAPFVLESSFTSDSNNPLEKINSFDLIAPASTSFNALNWQRYEFTFTVPINGYDYVDVFFTSKDNITGIMVDDVCVTEVSAGTTALAGVDLINCSTTVNLSANTPLSGYTGAWTVNSGSATITSSTSPTTTATITSGNAATFRWTITSGSSACASSDDIVAGYASSTAVTVNSPAICSGATATLTASGCSGSLLWSTGATTTSINVSPTVTTTYNVTCTPTTSANIALNPNFESATNFQNWSNWGNSAITTVAGEIQNGTKAAKVDATTTAGGFGQDIAAVAGEYFTATFWAKTTNITPGTILGIKFLNSSWAAIGAATETQLTSTAYQQYTISATAPPNTAYMQIYVWANESSIAYIDNITLIKSTKCNSTGGIVTVNSGIAATFTKTSATCTSTTANNNGSIALATNTGANRYGISTGTTYSGVAYASATTIGSLPMTLQSSISNNGGTYTVRLFNGSDACYLDYPLVVLPNNCNGGTCASTLAIPSTYQNVSLGTGNFNLLTFGNYTTNGGDAARQVFVGGNFTCNTGFAINTAGSGVPSLIVQGEWVNNAGAFTNNGALYYGDATPTGPLPTSSGGNTQQSNALNFSNLLTYYKDLSSCMKNMTANGTSALVSNTYTLNANNNAVAVFNLTFPSPLGSGIILDMTNVPAGGTVIINVPGSTLNFPTFTFTQSGMRGRTIWNFYEATSISMTSTSFGGSVLAPYASLTASGGNFEGQGIFGGNVTYTSNFENHDFLYSGTFTASACKCGASPALGSVGNYVWLDTNGDGIQNEPVANGINGISVQLWSTGADGAIGGTAANADALVATTTTANNGSANPGYYNFSIATTGNYYIKFPTTSGANILTSAGWITNNDTDSNPYASTGNSNVFNININGTGLAKDNPTYDAGYSACINLYGVSVGACTDVGGQSMATLTFTITAPSADHYGSGVVEVKAGGLTQYHPAGLSNPSTSSFLLPANGATGTITAKMIMGFNTYCNSTYSASYTMPAGCTTNPCGAAGTIGGTVYNDFNANGIRDTGEQGYGAGISGVTVKVFDNSGQVATTTTNSNGNFTVTGLTTAAKYRVEFSNYPSGYFSSQNGLASRTDVQIATVPACLYFGLNKPSNYCQDNPFVFISRYINGNPTASSSVGYTGSRGFLYRFPFNAKDSAVATGANFGGYGLKTTFADTLFRGHQIGSTWGLAYNKNKKHLYASTVLRRHTGYGTLGSGGIYKIDMNPTTPTISNWLNLDGLGFSTGNSVINTTSRNLPSTAYTPNNDAAAYDGIGKYSLGGLEVSEDGNKLFVVNLYDRKLYIIDISNPSVAPTAANVSSVSIPTNSCSATNDNFRPWALKFYNNKIYVGGVCSGETQVYQNGFPNLTATIYSLDPSNVAGGFTQVFQYNINYRYWANWHSTFTDIYASSPMLTDIEFDKDGSMILGMIDRKGMQMGNQNYLPSGTTLIDGTSSGDILRVHNNNGTYVMENNGVSGSLVGMGGATLSEPLSYARGFFDQQTPRQLFTNGNIPVHPTSAQGGLALHQAQGQVMTTSLSPVNLYAGGVLALKASNGEQLRAFELHASAYNSTGQGSPGKANGYGDLELMCNVAPVEIGNYVWVDEDVDGLQDPTEAPIVGANVRLYSRTGTLVGVTTTNSVGEYYFNTSNVDTTGVSTAGVPVTGLTGMSFNTRYYVVVGKDGAFNTSTNRLTISSGIYQITTANTGFGTNADANDSDGTLASGVLAVVNGFPYISLLSGSAGNSNHTYDFGFRCISPSFTGVTVNQATCTGSTANNNASIIVTSAIADKAAYSTGITYTGPAYASATALSSGSVTFGSLANPTGGQTYTIRIFNTASCYKDTTVILKSTICYAMCGATNIFQNNSFETGTYTVNQSYVDANNAQQFSNSNASTTITGWYVDHGLWINDATRATDGSRFVEIGTDFACWSDKIGVGTGSTQVCNGSTYELCFDYAAMEAADPTNLVADNTEIAIEFVNFSSASPQVKRIVGDGGTVLLKDAVTNTTAFAAGAAVSVPTASWDNLKYGIKPIAQAGWHRGCATFTVDFSGFFFTGPLTTMGIAFTKPSGKDLLIDNVKLIKCSGTCVVPPTVTTITANPATCTGSTPNANATVTVSATGGDKVGISGGASYSGLPYASLSTSLSGGTYTFTGLPGSTDVPGEFYTVRIFNGNNFAYKDTTILIPYSNCLNKCIIDQFHYSLPQLVDVPWGGTNPVSASNVAVTSTVQGGERDVLSTRTAGTSTVKFNVASWDPGVVYLYSGQPSELGSHTITYDGVDNNPTTINYTGLGGMAMNSGSFTFDTEIDNTTPLGTINYTIRVYSSAANWSYRTLSVSTATGYQTLTFTPAAFTIGGGTGANFASVGAVQLITSNTVAGTGWRIKNFFMPCACVNPTPTISGTNTICTGSSTTLTASGGTTYLWSTAATTAAIAVSPSSTTTYSVTVTNASGCTAVASRTVTVNALPSASASGSTVCVGGTINLTSSGGTTYSWSGPSSFTSTLQNPTRASATGAMSGTYTVTVTGTGGCTSTASASVAVPSLAVSNSVSACINHPLQDVANVSVTLTWANPPSGDDLKVTINNKIEYISVSSGLTSPQTVVFVVPANGITNNSITASWVNLTACTASSSFNAPAACSTDALCEKVLYLCGPVKPADGDAWDHGFMDYLMAVGVSAMTPAYTLPDATGYGLYNPMSIGTPLSINLNDYTMIVISPTTESSLAADLITALKGYSGGILMMNYTQVDDLGMTNGNASYSFQNNAYINNTSQINIYNYDNINPNYTLVQTFGTYFSNADAYLWINANDMSSAINGIYFNYTASDVLSGVPATHGARAYLGLHMNGLYGNAQNGGAMPAPVSSYFTPTKHLTLEAKVYLDNAIKNAATGIILTASGSTVCAGQTITLTATGVGASTYSWSGPNGFTSNLQNPTIANATTAIAGTYTVTATTSNGCTKTATATVTVNTASLPTVTPASRCGTGTVTLGAGGCVGGTLNWYAASTGGASLGTGISFTTPSLSATTTYHVACTASNGCVSTTRTSVAATIAAQPTVGVTGGDVTVCLGASDITLNSTVTGGTGTTSYIWQSSANNSTWATISGATSSSYVISATAVSNLYYRVSISMTGTACATNSSVGVRVIIVNDPTILITSDSTNVCSGGNAELSAALTDGAGVCSMQWQSSLNNNTWTTIPGATSNTYSSPPLTRKTYFRVITNCTGNGCGSNVASNVTGVIVQSSCTRICTSNIMVNSSFEANGVINASPTGWTITGGNGRTANDYVVVGGFAGYLTPTTLGTYGYIYQDILGVFPGSNYTVTLFAGTHETTMNHGVAIQFYNSSNVLLGGSGWTEVDHDVDATGNLLLYSLSATAPTGTAYMRIIGRADGDILKLDAFCMQCPSTTLTASVSAATICSGSTTTLTSSIAEANMTYQWQSSANNSTWANISGATSSSYTTPVLATNTYYRIIINSTSGCTVTSASTLVTVVNPPNAGTGSSVSMCKSEVSSTTDLYTLLIAEQAGGTWSAISPFPSTLTAAIINAKITAGVLERKGLPVGTYLLQYTVTGTSPCPNDTENVTITINPCCPPTVCMPMATRRQ